MHPKASFFLGFGSGLAVLFALGFFVMVGVYFRGGSARNATTVKTTGASAPASQKLPNDNNPVPSIQLAAVTEKDHILGSPDAPITIVEFSDPECPFCKRFHPTMEQIVAQNEGNVRWVYRHFPLDSLHSKARKEAEATECAGELAGNDGFWKYIKRLFEITPSNDGLDPAQLPKIAKEVGLDTATFEECLNSGRHAKTVQEHYNQAIAAGGQGTPYSVIVAGDQRIPINGALPAAQIQQAIDSLK